VLTLQNEIAAAIAAEIQGKLTPQQKSRLASSRPVNPEAQLAYWKARYFLSSRKDRIADRKSLEYAEQAVRIDPGYAPAQAALAMAYTLNSDDIDASEIMPRAKVAAQRAIALDEELAEAHMALGTILLIHDLDWAGAEREARRALSLNPSDADAHWLLSNYLAAIGRVDEAVVESKQARELYPLSFEMNRNVGRILCLAGRYDEALDELRQAGDMRPNSSAVDVWIVRAHLMKGSAQEAVDTDLRIHAYRDRFDTESLDALRAAYSTGSLRGYWTKLKELATPEFRSQPAAVYRLAEINAYLGDRDEAFRWLEKAYNYRTMWMPWVKVDPSLDSLRSDPRFDQLLRRMGLTP
jgi:Flp pilus assembly protein TadD